VTRPSEPLGVALVGCGAVAALYHAPALTDLERQGLVAVRALVDPELERIDELRREFPAAAAVAVERLAELARAGVQLAIVASPPRFHAAQTIELLGAGLSVLCEKPLAATPVEAEAMVDAARRARGVLAAGLFRRFFPATQTIGGMLARGALGEIERFECFEGGAFCWPARSRAFLERTGLQGGVLLDIGVHVLDLLLLWWGEPLDVRYEDDAMGGIEANCRLRLTFAPGFSGTVRLSRDWALANRWVLQGTRGWVSWEANEASAVALGFEDTGFALDGRLHVERNANGVPALGERADTFEDTFVRQLANVVAAIRGSAPLAVPGEAALPSLRLIETCYRNRTLMPMPWLGAEEAERAARLGGSPASTARTGRVAP
jgi:predicted dehydrogenase